MDNRGAREILLRMKITDEAGGVVVAKNVQGLIIIDYFFQLNEISVEGFSRVLQRPGGTTGGLSNTGVAVSAMDEANLQGMIYYTKYFKRIGRTCTHIYVEISKVHAMNHHQDMKESHKDPKAVPTVDPRDCPKPLETVEE